MAYPGKDELKEYIGIPALTTDEDDLCTMIMAAVQERVKRYTDREFVAVTEARKVAVGFKPQDQRHILTLRWDLQSLSTITDYDGNSVDTSELILVPVTGPPYRQIHKFRGQLWGSFVHDSKYYYNVSGTWGYTADVPDDLALAMLEIGQAQYVARRSGGMMKQTTVTRGGIIISAGSIPESALEVLDHYRRATL